jgi:lipopolysaccharide biosynthesis regulator YciM
MKLQIFPSTGSFIPVDIEANQITQEELNSVFSQYNVEVSSNMTVTYAFKTPEGVINRGTFDSNTIVGADLITISISMRETKAANEVDEVIEIAKEALISQTYQDLKSACRQLRTLNEEVKAIIGDYTHMSNAQLIQVIEKALEFLAPTTEIPSEIVQLVQKMQLDLNKVLELASDLHTRVTTLENNPSNNTEVEALRSDLAAFANHYGFVLPNHSNLFEKF